MAMTNEEPAFKRIWDGTPKGYSAIEGEVDLLWGEQRIYRSAKEAEVEFLACEAKKAKGAMFFRPVAVYCQRKGCSNVVFIHDAIDMETFKRGEMQCSTCKELEYRSLTPMERAQRDKEFERLFSNLNTYPLNNSTKGK